VTNEIALDSEEQLEDPSVIGSYPSNTSNKDLALTEVDSITLVRLPININVYI
jgi:hypothetical protein